jgi:hypothetical protein
MINLSYAALRLELSTVLAEPHLAADPAGGSVPGTA